MWIIPYLQQKNKFLLSQPLVFLLVYIILQLRLIFHFY